MDQAALPYGKTTPEKKVTIPVDANPLDEKRSSLSYKKLLVLIGGPYKLPLSKILS